MSTMLTLIQTATTTVVGFAATVPVGHVVRSTAGLALCGGAIMVFRPLLVGIGRAAMLAVRPRPSKPALPSHS